MNEYSKEETSLTDISQTIKKLINFFLINKFLFGLIFVCVFSLKLLSFYLTPDTYLTKMSFVIENSMSSESGSNMGGFSSMASQFGINTPGSINSSADYISSKNLNTFFNSFFLISKVLHKRYDNKSNRTFAQVYSSVYRYDKNIPVNELDRIIYENIIKNEFKIEQLKGSSFLEIKTEMRDPNLAIYFQKTILNEAINEYTKVKIGKQSIILEETQKTVDSILFLLNAKVLNNYKKEEGLFNSNQAILRNRAVVDESSRDKQFLLTLYGQVVTQLNSTKMLINQQKPYIQILDDIQTPLYTSKNTLSYGVLVAIVMGFFSSIIILSIIYFLKSNQNV